jgi:hypothetical protein
VFSSQNHVPRSRAVDTLFLLSAFVPPGFAREVFNEINVFLLYGTQQEGEVSEDDVGGFGKSCFLSQDQKPVSHTM